jgi:hypothetical protein
MGTSASSGCGSGGSAIRCCPQTPLLFACVCLPADHDEPMEKAVVEGLRFLFDCETSM